MRATVCKMCVIWLSLFLISGCAHKVTIEKEYSGHQNYVVSAPLSETPPEALANLRKPIKVKRIDITAPVKDDNLFSVAVSVEKPISGDKFLVGGAYLIDDDLEPSIRQALTQLFEIDPNEAKIVEVEARVVATHTIKRELYCELWTSRISFRMWINLVEDTTEHPTKEFYESSKIQNCGNPQYVPSADDVSEALQEAFTKIMSRIVNESHD